MDNTRYRVAVPDVKPAGAAIFGRGRYRDLPALVTCPDSKDSWLHEPTGNKSGFIFFVYFQVDQLVTAVFWKGYP